MRFDSVEYMEWAKMNSWAPVNLARSGVPGLDFQDVGLDFQGIRINGDHPDGWTPLIETIAARIFPRLDEIKAKTRAWIESGRAAVRTFIESEPRLGWVEPDGGLVAFPRVEENRGGAWGGDRLARVLRESYGMSIVAGLFFEDSRTFRLGYGVPADMLDQGLKNIRAALSS